MTKSKEQHLWELVASSQAGKEFTVLSHAQALAENDALRAENVALRKAQASAEPDGYGIMHLSDGEHARLVRVQSDLLSLNRMEVSVEFCGKDGARRIDFIAKSANPAPAPAPAPGVGGVTEEHLDEIEHHHSHADDSAFFDAMRAARAAIRAQKPPVDREAIRREALDRTTPILVRRALLRAIGDVPPEATSAPQAEQFSIKRGDTFSAPLVSLPRVSLAEPAPPPAPAEAEGPWYAITTKWSGPDRLICNASGYAFHVQQFYRKMTPEKLVRKLNWAWEAEQGKLVKPPATREEMLVALVDLAVKCGDIEPFIGDYFSIITEISAPERAMLRAHLAKKQEAKS